MAPTIGSKPSGRMVSTVHAGWTDSSGIPSPARSPSTSVEIGLFPGEMTRVTFAGVRSESVGTSSNRSLAGVFHVAGLLTIARGVNGELSVPHELRSQALK